MDPTRGKPWSMATSQFPSAAVTSLSSWCNLSSILIAYIAKNGPSPISGLRIVKLRPRGPVMDPTHGENLPMATSQYQSASVTSFPSGCKLASNLWVIEQKRCQANFGVPDGQATIRTALNVPYPRRALAHSYKPVLIRFCHIVFFLA